MARSVFYSFHYDDIWMVNIVRNRYVTYGGEKASGIIDHAEFEKIKRQGDAVIKRWIDSQLKGTSATVVLIGKETLNRKYVQYEIMQSFAKGNAILGVYIYNKNNKELLPGLIKPNYHKIVGQYQYNIPVYFDEIVDGIYDFYNDDGYHHLDEWVENAVNNKRGILRKGFLGGLFSG